MGAYSKRERIALRKLNEAKEDLGAALRIRNTVVTLSVLDVLFIGVSVALTAWVNGFWGIGIGVGCLALISLVLASAFLTEDNVSPARKALRAAQNEYEDVVLADVEAP